MIVNIRGTNGSGKTTVVRELMAAAASCRPLFGVLGVRAPEAYRLEIEGVGAPVFVLGPYDVPTGGCDAVHPFDLILYLLDKYAPLGHVVFEGSLVSDHYGKVGRFLEQHGVNVIVAFMAASLEECLVRVGARRSGRGDGRTFNPENTTRRYASIQKVRDKIEGAGVMRTLTLSGDAPHLLLLEELRHG